MSDKGKEWYVKMAEKCLVQAQSPEDVQAFADSLKMWSAADKAAKEVGKSEQEKSQKGDAQR